MMVVSEPSEYRIRTINKTVDACPYKFAQGHKLMWSKWVLGKPEIHSNLINCFSFVRNGNVVTKGNLVVLSVRATLEGTRSNLHAGNYDLVMEFENFDMANSFMKEFQNALLKQEPSPTNTDKFNDKVNFSFSECWIGEYKVDGLCQAIVLNNIAYSSFTKRAKVHNFNQPSVNALCMKLMPTRQLSQQHRRSLIEIFQAD
ncbi:hypothetical protein BCR33DRAFT_833820 [Rhizoclosmatium globosum]|uniref:Uncharacterized protein n=1 Tax=Rhizoclosmatium globosum TaxID=329046 RepID=A0A1Y2CW86_9FUNG|nr:hypothetical protein BCR33DRAFT_833820 [Rhizoclosmatium globosum]|eukprot:ORY51292.1 hypothetical protein BCR33DRAFT_833820 [Rhizoclosmatium globosum]